MINYKKPKFWLVLASVLILILVGIPILSNSSQGKSSSFPPSKNQEVVLKPGPVIYLKDASTNHSLGPIGSKFSFTEDKLVVEEKEETKFFEISYDKTTLSLDEFQKQLQMDEEFPDISSYKKILRYDLVKPTKDSPGYRLYILDDDTYWMATLYKNDIWRILSMDASSSDYEE